MKGKKYKAYMMNDLSDRGEVAMEIFSGVMNRIGLMTFRAAMILTVLRAFEEGRFEKKEPNDTDLVIFCNEDDFKTALEWAELARNNALAIFNRIYVSRQDKDNLKIEMSKAQFKAKNLDTVLKMQKEGKSLSDIAMTIGAKKSTIQEWLK